MVLVCTSTETAWYLHHIFPLPHWESQLIVIQADHLDWTKCPILSYPFYNIHSYLWLFQASIFSVLCPLSSASETALPSFFIAQSLVLYYTRLTCTSIAIHKVIIQTSHKSSTIVHSICAVPSLWHFSRFCLEYPCSYFEDLIQFI